MINLFLYVFLIILNILDYLSTVIVLQLGGIEYNPIQLYAIEQFGTIGMLYFKLPVLLFIGILLLFAQYSKKVTFTFIAANLIYSFVLLNNLLIVLTLLEQHNVFNSI